MVAPILVKHCPFTSSVWSGLTDQSVHDIGVTDEAGMCNGSLTLLSLFLAFSFYLQQLVSPFSCLHDTSMNSMVPADVIVCQLFPATKVDACAFQIPLANILEMQSGAVYQTVSCDQFTIHCLLIYKHHSCDICTWPQKTKLTKEKMHAPGICLLQYNSVANFVSPCAAEYILQAAEIEAFQVFFLPDVCCPGFVL